MDIYIAGESGDTVVLVCTATDAPFEIETSDGVDYLFAKSPSVVEQELGDQQAP